MKLYTATLVAAAAVITAATFLLTARETSRPATGRSLLGREGTLTTSRESLDAVIASARERVAADPGDGQAAVLLADALMRAARVNADASLALEAERVLKTTLTHGPDDYVAARMLGVVLLSQHRFAQALDAARQAQKHRPEDAWNYAVAGDALLELGRYQEAFDSFDAAAARRPDAGVYARIAYARELQGDIDGAIRIMRMAVEATGAHDPEAQAWTLAQVGSLLLLQRRLDDAERELARAAYVFPGHPYVEAGRMRLRIAQRRYQEALAIAEAAPETPESLAVRGDLLARLKLRAEAEAAYIKAERLEREGWAAEEPQPAALARFFAERNRKLPEAVALAERAAADRQDIHTLDALAWAYFRAGRIDEASAAIERAVKVGTVDPRIRCHASAIAAAKAGRLPRHGEVCDPLEPNPIPIDGRMADAGHAGTAATVTALLGSGTVTKAAVHRSDLLLDASDRVYSPRVASPTEEAGMAQKQGDVALLQDPSVQSLLQAPIPARLAYTWTDGSPRVIPIWFHWDGEAFVIGTPTTAPKLKALAKDDRVALTIDENGFPARVLLVRGTAAVEMMSGVVPEYASSAVRYLGDEQGRGWLAQAEKMFPQMARISIRPQWVGFIDFQSRFPSAIAKAIGAA